MDASHTTDLATRKSRNLCRNRSPCKACQSAKRKCDQVKPKCTLCQKKNIPCEPSIQGRWRNRTLEDVESPSIQQDAVECSTLNNPIPAITEDRHHDDTTHVVKPSPIELSPRPLPWTDFNIENLSSFFFSAFPFDLMSNHGSLPEDLGSTLSGQDINGVFWYENEASCESNDRLLESENGIQAIAIPAAGISTHLDTTICIVLKPLEDSGNLEIVVKSHRDYLHSLWRCFVDQIASFLTPLGNRADNPFLKYLVPKAEDSPSLLVAVLYLTQTICKRGHDDNSTRAEARFLDERTKDIRQQLERENAILSANSADKLGIQDSQMLITLSTVLVLCMAFLASQDATPLVFHVELAVIVCQELFKTHAEEEQFLYLAKLLGFIQNSLLFSSHASKISAPDYLSAALEFHDEHNTALCEIDGYLECHNHFRDLDLFSGLSASMASIVYTLGTLVKRKRAGLRGTGILHEEFMRMFEADMDGLEARLRRHLSLISKRQESQANSQKKCSLSGCLNSLNEAVLWSIWTIFLTDIKGRSPAKDLDARNAVDHILDACAEVPIESSTAPLILFPLMVGGLKTAKKVYREFVLTRLQNIRNIGITDTKSLCDDLQKSWSNGTATGNMTTLPTIVF